MALVGHVARPHGLRGQVVVNPETDFPQDRFRPGAELFIYREGRLSSVTVTTVRFHRDRPIIGLQGLSDVTEASELAGSELRVPRESLASLPDGTFYWHDLVGCAVETIGGGAVGVVSRVEGTMRGSRLVVTVQDREVLVPLAGEICHTIDIGERRIVIDPPEGLLELNDAVRHRHDLSGDGRTSRRVGDRRSRD
jgi:16S rRNA processing protein RimM